MKRIILPIIVIIFSSFITSTSFDEVLTNTKNKELKKRLIAFQKGGIEKRPNKTAYSTDKLISKAKTFLGTPHQMGGESKKGIDCSGLIMISFKDQGVALPRSSQEQARFGKIIPQQKDFKNGDVLFFYNSYKTPNFITHSGIYLGDGNFIHTSSKKGVQIINLNTSTYWKERFLFATRMNFE